MREMLLRAVCEQPDDELARLACADSFEEQGLADRAEFIRVQLGLDRLPKGDPLAGPLAVPAEALLAEHETRWLGEWADRLVRWTFRRGFLDGVVLEPETFLRHGEELFRLHPVREVQFVGADGTPCGPDWVEELAAAGAFAHVRALDASGSMPSAGPAWCRALARSAHLRRLEELNFAGDHRADSVFDDPAALAALCQADHLRNLRALVLACPRAPNAPGDAGVSDIVQSAFAGRLQTLNLSGWQVSDQGAQALAGGRRLRRLRVLELGWCEQLGRAGVQAVLDAPHLPALEELSLGGDLDVAAIARSPRLGRLRELGLNTNANAHERDLPAAAWAELARSPHAGRLRRLHLLFGLLGVEGAAALFGTPGPLRLHALTVMGMQHGGDELAGLVARSPALAGLTALELAACGITAAGVAPLLAAPFTPRLSLFCVAGNRIGARGLQAMLRSPLAGGGLTELHLHHCQLPPGALRRLMHWRGLANVARIELGNNRLDTAALLALSSSPRAGRLTRLHLGSGEIDPDALAALAGPACLPRLRDLTVPASSGEGAVAALRQRFGPRVALDTNG
jgi:uncharacterized protein (TIGR02996 family)